MKLQQLLSYTRKAVDDYRMIRPGDKIAVGISGGKDSLALLYALKGLQRFYPNPFTLSAISVHLGYPDFHLDRIQSLCETLDVPFHVVHTDIAEIIFKDRQERSPCSLCAKMRKGALNEKAKELGCGKIAYAHHKDDMVETMLLSLIYEGRFHSFAPVTYLDRMKLTVIRPMMYVQEADVVGFMRRYDLPVEKNPCPKDGFTRREYVKQLLAKLNQENPGVKNRMFTAIENGSLPGWTKERNPS